MKTIFDYDEDTGQTICIIQEHNNIFTGVSTCNEKDQDMKNKYTGAQIAETRAQISMLQHIKNNEIKPELRALKQLYYSMNKSRHYNQKSYEAKMLYRAIKRKEQELEEIKTVIKKEQDWLKEYIDNKDKLYQKLRNKEKAQTD